MAYCARRLGAELDVVVARELGAPGQPELAVGAVTANGGRFLNQDVVDELRVPAAYLEEADELVCLAEPEPFVAVGAHYERFEPTPEAEVRRLLEQARAGPARRRSGGDGGDR